MIGNEELVEKYFSGELSASEESMLRDRLAEDAAFREQFEFERDLQVSFTESERARYKKALLEIESEFKERKNSSVPEKQRGSDFGTLFKIAASFAVLVSLGAFLYLYLGTSSSEKLFEANFSKYPNTVVQISRGVNTAENDELSAFRAYEAGDYDVAIPLFERLSQTSGAAYTDFFLAQCYLAAKQYEKAIAILKKLETLDGDFKDESRWYLALAYLGIDNEQTAKEYLEKVIHSESFKYEEASSLLQELQ